METITVTVAYTQPMEELAARIEAAAAAEGLVVRVRRTLVSYPGSTHWHLGRPGARGTLEVTLWPRERRLWLDVHANRSAPWIAETLPRLKERLEGNGS